MRSRTKGTAKAICFANKDDIVFQEFQRKYYYHREAKALLDKHRMDSEHGQTTAIKNAAHAFSVQQPKNQKLILNPDSYRHFCMLCEAAVAFAKACAFDITVEFQENKPGAITLIGENFILSHAVPRGAQRTLAKLISHADYVWMDVVSEESENLVRLVFSYEIYEEIASI